MSDGVSDEQVLKAIRVRSLHEGVKEGSCKGEGPCAMAAGQCSAMEVGSKCDL